MPFLPAVERAKEACQNSGHDLANHFEDILEIVEIGSKAQRQIESVKLSRYACYLIVQNTDPGEEVVANLFRATQTEEKLRRENIKEPGVTMPEDLPTEESIFREVSSRRRRGDISERKPAGLFAISGCHLLVPRR